MFSSTWPSYVQYCTLTIKMRTDLTSDNLITPKELTSILNISMATVYRLVDGRKIPFFKVGGRLRFSKEDIDQYLKRVRFESIQ